MIDYHCHILPGFDDGSVSIDESIAMAKALAAAGYTRVCCTPHCMKGYYEYSPSQVREATLMLQADLDNAGVKLELWPGMEYTLDECLKVFADDFLPLGDSRLVLCEAPHYANPYFVHEGLELITARGYIPLVAHPERTEYFYQRLRARDADATLDGDSRPSPAPRQEAPGFWQKLWRFRKAADGEDKNLQNTAKDQKLPARCLFHANLGSFVNYYPGQTQQRAYELLKAGRYECVASDLHNSAMAGKVLVFGIEKFASNPLLAKLAGRTPAELEQIAERLASAEGQGEQQELDL